MPPSWVRRPEGKPGAHTHREKRLRSRLCTNLCRKEGFQPQSPRPYGRHTAPQSPRSREGRRRRANLRALFTLLLPLCGTHTHGFRESSRRGLSPSRPKSIQIQAGLGILHPIAFRLAERDMSPSFPKPLSLPSADVRPRLPGPRLKEERWRHLSEAKSSSPLYLGTNTHPHGEGSPPKRWNAEVNPSLAACVRSRARRPPLEGRERMGKRLRLRFTSRLHVLAQ